MNPKYLLISGLLLLPAVSFADDYIVTGRDSRLYEQPDVNGSFARNMNDENISVSMGMVFKVISKGQGWVRVNYTPGVSAFVLSPSLTESSVLKNPIPGEYALANNSSKRVVIDRAESKWVLNDGDLSFSGSQFDKVIIFFDSKGEQRYSFANIDGEMMVIDYSNDVTKFF